MTITWKEIGNDEVDAAEDTLPAVESRIRRRVWISTVDRWPRQYRLTVMLGKDAEIGVVCRWLCEVVGPVHVVTERMDSGVHMTMADVHASLEKVIDTMSPTQVWTYACWGSLMSGEKMGHDEGP